MDECKPLMIGSIEGAIESGLGSGNTAARFATFHIDSFANAIHRTEAMSYASEYLSLDLAVALNTGKYCDLLGGDQVSGAATLAVGGMLVEGAVSGARHCGGVDQHVSLMREAGAEPVAVAPRYTQFVNEHMFPMSVRRCRLTLSNPH